MTLLFAPFMGITLTGATNGSGLVSQCTCHARHTEPHWFARRQEIDSPLTPRHRSREFP